MNIQNRLMALAFSTLFFLGLCSVVPPAEAYFFGFEPPELSLKVMYDDNISRSPDGEGEQSDVAFKPAVSAERQAQVGEFTFTRMELKLEGAIHERFSGLNYIAPVVGAGIRQQMGDRPGAPHFRIDLALGYEFFDQDDRFGAFAKPRAELWAQLEERLDVAVYYEYDNRFASEQSVFDVQGHSFGVTADLAFTPDVFFVLGYRYRRGDVVVHRQNPPGIMGEAIRGREFPLDTFKERYTAVNVRNADTHTIDIGMRFYIGFYTELHAGYTYEEIRKGSEEFPSNAFFAAVRHSL